MIHIDHIHTHTQMPPLSGGSKAGTELTKRNEEFDLADELLAH